MSISVVTGAAGFIGSHIAEILLKAGHQVIGIDNFNDYYSPELKRKNILDFIEHPNFKLIDGDIQFLDWSLLLEDIDVIYHQAAQAGVRASWGTSFRAYTERNINATQVILEAAKEAKNLKRFIYASTSSIYGNAETLPTSETIAPLPVSPYGITKLAAEQMGKLYHDNFGLPFCALRYFTVYGPRQRPDMGFHKFYKAAIEGKAIDVFGDGRQTRDFTFISDVVAANLAAANCDASNGQIFNIGGGSRVMLEDVLDMMGDIMGQPIVRNYIDQSRGDARHTSADVTKAKDVLGFNPQVSLHEGLTQEWQWIQGLYLQAAATANVSTTME